MVVKMNDGSAYVTQLLKPGVCGSWVMILSEICDIEVNKGKCAGI